MRRPLYRPPRKEQSASQEKISFTPFCPSVKGQERGSKVIYAAAAALHEGGERRNDRPIGLKRHRVGPGDFMNSITNRINQANWVRVGKKRRRKATRKNESERLNAAAFTTATGHFYTANLDRH